MPEHSEVSLYPFPASCRSITFDRTSSKISFLRGTINEIDVSYEQQARSFNVIHNPKVKTTPHTSLNHTSKPISLIWTADGQTDDSN